jgi:hypothetical protein
MAVVTEREWLRDSVNIFGYLIPGKIKAYTTGEEGDARAFIASCALLRTTLTTIRTEQEVQIRLATTSVVQ